MIHAVMALGGHHVESSTTQSHHGTALSLLRGSLASSDRADAQSLIDAIIVLFSYDVSDQSKQNSYSNAKKIF